MPGPGLAEDYAEIVDEEGKEAITEAHEEGDEFISTILEENFEFYSEECEVFIHNGILVEEETRT